MTNSYLFENVTVKTSVIIVNQQQNVSYRYFAHFKFANFFFFPEIILWKPKNMRILC